MKTLIQILFAIILVGGLTQSCSSDSKDNTIKDNLGKWKEYPLSTTATLTQTSGGAYLEDNNPIVYSECTVTSKEVNLVVVTSNCTFRNIIIEIKKDQDMSTDGVFLIGKVQYGNYVKEDYANYNIGWIEIEDGILTIFNQSIRLVDDKDDIFYFDNNLRFKK